MATDPSIELMKKLSPRRNSTQATTVEELVSEQLHHFGIEPDKEYGQTLQKIVARMYESQHDIERLWPHRRRELREQREARDYEHGRHRRKLH